MNREVSADRDVQTESVDELIGKERIVGGP
jgi:hypothetical protein